MFVEQPLVLPESAKYIYIYIYILSKTQVVLVVYLYTVFHVAHGWSTIFGSYTATKVKLQDSLIALERDESNRLKLGLG